MQDIKKDPQWFDDNVEPYVDGALDASDVIVFEAGMQNDSVLRQQVDAARQIKSSLGQLTISEMPEAIVVAVEKEIADQERSNVLHLFAASARPRKYTWPVKLAYSSVAAAASIMLLFLVVRSEPDELVPDEPTQAEVDAALIEVKRTLAFVSEMGYEREDIVNGHVVDPVQKAMSYIFLTEPNTEVQ